MSCSADIPHYEVSSPHGPLASNRSPASRGWARLSDIISSPVLKQPHFSKVRRAAGVRRHVTAGPTSCVGVCSCPGSCRGSWTASWCGMAGRNLVPSRSLEETTAGLSSAHLKIVALEMVWYMRNQILRDSDWAGMAHGLEVRVPFVDICLLQKIGRAPGVPRSPHESAIFRVFRWSGLPAEVLAREKTGFSTPIQGWMRDRISSGGGRGYRPWALHVYKQQTN